MTALVAGAPSNAGLKWKLINGSDDFIVTGANPEILPTQIKPEIEAFLAERGLTLSPEKTKLSPINEGFNFLGFTLRKYEQTLLVKPERSKAKQLKEKAKALLAQLRGVSFHVMLIKLNSVLRGWAYAHRQVVAKKLMSRLDNDIFKLVCQWLRKEHRRHTGAWISKRYRKRYRGRSQFMQVYLTEKGTVKTVCLFRMSDLPIRYHNKIRAKAVPYEPEYWEYFKQRNAWHQGMARKDRAFMNATSFDKLADWR